MARDIEEFLRKAAERRKQQGAAPPAASPSVPAQPSPARPAAAPQRANPPPRQAPVEAEVVRPQRLGSGVAQHVRQHIDTKDIVEHVSHLGEEVAEADDKLEKRIHDKFDAGMGSLAGDRKTAGLVTPAAQAGTVPPNELLNLLRNPRTLRQAILLSEILKRPEY